MSTHRLIRMLEQQIEALAREVSTHGDLPIAHARFDSALFANYGTRIRDYLEEVQKNFVHLQTAVRHSCTSQVAYLSEILVIQITALKRELATYNLRKISRSQGMR